ncbi:acetylxylan esterase [Armatimonas sp.]|uniref:glucuronyl esterase domain-containing protein n=1 Tax=Armatimonas sp. TaxID=1872638 RepID=UPI0037538B66
MMTPLLLALVLTAQTPPTTPQTQTPPARPQPPRLGPSPEMQAKTQADHKHLLELLKIEKLRPGPSGTPTAPNAANSDEAKVGTYTLPDPLMLKNGKKVASKKDWEARRKELFEDFDREMYGRTPKNTPKVTWEVTETLKEKKGEIAVVTKKLVGHVDNKDFPSIKVDIQLTLTTPESATKPVPVIMEFGFIFPTRPGVPAFAPPPGSGPSWQEQVLAKGWGYAILSPASIQADNGAGLREGIIGLVNKGEPRKVDDWGALKAWAWGASRALDYFETDKAVNAKQVAIEGLSRYGKAAVVTMAYEPRFSIGYIGSSGTGGAKLYRRIFGEQIENVASSGEYHWMAGNFVKYASGSLGPNDLPVDAHELVALCAPRPVFISCGSPFVEGNWVDSKGQFLAGVAAGPVYSLLGKKPLATDTMPEIGKGLTDTDIAFRQHEGGHTIGPNWPYLLTWAERYWK